MNRRPSVASLLLLALCVALAIGLYREATAPPERFWTDGDAARAKPMAVGAVRFAPPPRQEFSETDARPLFIASRRPNVTTTRGAAGTAQPLTPRPPGLMLVGIIAGPKERIALVKVTNSVEVRKVGEGETVGGWQIRRIFADHIIVAANSREQTVAFPPQHNVSGQPAGVRFDGTPFPPSPPFGSVHRP